MGTDLARSNILFPFTPSSSVHRQMVAGINDCFMVIPATGAAGSPLPYKDYFVFLDNISDGGADVTYTFKASSPGGIHTIPFTVTKNEGIVRISSSNVNLHAVIIVDSDNMYGSYVPGSSPYAEIEPAKIVWRTDKMTSIQFWNARRHWNPEARPYGTPYQVLSITDGPIKLENGYNVSLQYEEGTQTLYIRGIPGAGKGLPSEEDIYWDVGPPAVSEAYIKSINGITGNVKMNGSESVNVSRTDDAEITVAAEEL